MTERKIRALAIAYTTPLRRTAGLLGIVVALSLFLYGFFLLEAVAHTANRTHAQRDIKALTSKLSTLEEQYLTATRSMTLDHARSMGFVTPTNVSTVYSIDPARALSISAQ